MKRLLPVILLAIFIPQVVLAAWWNPISWFVPKSEEGEIIQTDQVEDKSSDNSPEPSIQNDVAEKVVEKVITIDNPELQKQINALIAENTSLKRQTASLAEQVRMLSGQQQKEPEKEPTKTYQSEVKPLVDKLEDIQKDIVALKILIAERCYIKTSPTSSTTVFSNSTSLNFSEGLFWSGESRAWIGCGEIKDQILPSLEAKEEKILKDVDLLKLRYGVPVLEFYIEGDEELLDDKVVSPTESKRGLLSVPGAKP
jgi:hypothetical protein